MSGFTNIFLSNTVSAAPAPPAGPSTIWYVAQNVDVAGDGMYGSSVGITDDGSKIIIGGYNAPESVDTAGTQFDGAAYAYTAGVGSPIVFGSADLFSHTDAQNYPDSFAADHLNGAAIKTIAPFDNGATIAIGAYYQLNKGAVYLFDLGADYSQAGKIALADAANAQYFGSVIATYGDGSAGSRMAISAWNETGGVGSVYIYENQLGTWTEIQNISGAYTENDENFGLTLSLSRDGTTLAIGQSGTAAGGPSNFFYRSYSWNGSSYAFVEQFLPNPADDLVVPNATSYGGMQSDISDDGTTLVSAMYSNRVWVSTLSGTWSSQEVTSLMPGLARTGNSVPAGLAINGAGDVIFVGAPNEVGTNGADGVVHVLQKTDGVWALAQTLDNPDSGETGFSSWGQALASNIAGDAVVVGNPWGQGFGGGGNWSIIRSKTA